MKRYTFTASIRQARGSQTYYADAETEEEARAQVEGGGGVFVCEEIEVYDLDEFELDFVDEDMPDEHAGARP